MTTEFRLAPGMSGEDVDNVLARLPPALAGRTRIVALRADAGAVFASPGLLELFEAATLQELNRGPFAAGAKRLAETAGKLSFDDLSRHERIRFNLGSAPRSLTFECQLVPGEDGAALLVAAAVDGPPGRRAPTKTRKAAPKKGDPLEPSTRAPDQAGAGRVRFVWRTDADGRIQEIGAPFAHLTGRRLAECIGDPASRRTLSGHLAQRATWRDLAVSLPAGAGRKGADAPAALAGLPRFDRDRRFLGHCGFGVAQIAPASAPGEDETCAAEASPEAPRAQAEFSAAQDGAGAAKAVLDALPIGALVCRGRRALFANRALLDLLGLENLAEGVGSGSFEPVAAVLQRLGRGSESVEFRTRDGRRSPLRASARTIEWFGGPASLATFQPRRDVDRRTLEDDLRRLQAEAGELNAILDTAVDGLAVLDAEGRILSLNRSGEALFGQDENEVAGEPFTLLLAPESRGKAQAYFDGLKSDGLFSLLNDGREVSGLARQGGAIPLFMTLGRLGAGSGRDARFCALLRDMTHWKTIERELDGARREAERASALKSDFLAKVSHEIRTPLNAILGFAEVILEERFGPIGNPRYKDYLKDVHSSGALVMSLVNDLLDLSKIEAGKMDLAFAPVDVNRIVTECVSLMQPQANSAGVMLRLSLAPRLPHVVADERSLRQIVLNLLSNAVKFNTPGGQAIAATAFTDAGCAVLRVRDTGIGMSAADLDVALEPFGQVAGSRSSGGTGLGLPLTKALVEANLAAFSIESKPEEGTMVEIAFPPARVFAG